MTRATVPQGLDRYRTILSDIDQNGCSSTHMQEVPGSSPGASTKHSPISAICFLLSLRLGRRQQELSWANPRANRKGPQNLAVQCVPNLASSYGAGFHPI